MMKYASLRLSPILLLLPLLVMACQEPEGPEAYEDIVTHRQEIKGGVEDTESRSVVGIYSQIGNFGGGLCSGTLIAPNLVLTAQHCIAQTPNDFAICGSSSFTDQTPARNILVTTEPTLDQNTRTFYRTWGVFVPPDGDDICGFDIALLILADNVPSTDTIPITPRIDQFPIPNEEYTAIGYGETGNGGGFGVRRRLEGRRIVCEGNNCNPQYQVQSTEFLGTDGTCQGDSGGPAIDDQGRVLGALSRGPQGCLASVYSSVARWSGWVRDIGAQAAERGGYDEPRWVAEGISAPDPNDPDNDGILNEDDNCPDKPNINQNDFDEDGVGDVCDNDSDNDGVDDDQDNCPILANEEQGDADNDGIGNACDDDYMTSPPDDEDPDDEGNSGFVDDDCSGSGFVSDCDGSSSNSGDSASSGSCQTVPMHRSIPLAPMTALGLIMGAAFWWRRERTSTHR